MQIAIFGLGYVGATAAACLASQGHRVIGVDPNPEKVSKIMSGVAPITEPGLDDLTSAGVRDGLLSAVTVADKHVVSSDLIIVCVGTPSAVDGSHNMSFIAEVSRQMLQKLMRKHGLVAGAAASADDPPPSEHTP